MNLENIKFYLIIMSAVMILTFLFMDYMIAYEVHLHWMLVIAIMAIAITASVYTGLLLGIWGCLTVSSVLGAISMHYRKFVEARQHMLKDYGTYG